MLASSRRATMLASLRVADPMELVSLPAIAELVSIVIDVVSVLPVAVSDLGRLQAAEMPRSRIAAAAGAARRDIRPGICASLTWIDWPDLPSPKLTRERYEE